MRTIIINRIAASIALCCFATSFASGATHTYEVRVAEDLGEMRVVARFADAPGAITARSRDAGSALQSAIDCGSGEPVKRSGRRLLLPDTLRCLAYTVDLATAARADPRNFMLDDRNIVVSPTVWMWRPRLGGNDAIDITFDLPADIQISVPWQVLDADTKSFRLRSSPQSGSAIAVFGSFEIETVSIGDSDIRIVVLRGTGPDFDDAVIDWVRATAAGITLVYGRFPNPDSRVVLFPTRSRADSPVRFGRVVRDGGETVELIVDPQGSIEDMQASWTATHEFTHLMMPYIDRDQRWISEGFAQYYQNLILARAGHYTEQAAWQKLYDGLERGQASVPHLSPNDAASRNARSTRMKVYWSGAALALIADVELRRRSGNVESLDSALGELQRCCLPSRRAWQAAELFAQLDEFVADPVFVELYEQHADTRGFPDFRAVLEQLGVHREGSTVHLDDEAPLAEIRAALTGRRYTGRRSE